MIRRVDVQLWGTFVGAAAPDPALPGFAVFEFDPAYLAAHPNPAPLMMPEAGPYAFRGLRPETFHGLPGLLADSLPDRFGHALIDTWLARQGRTPSSMEPLERLCYVGSRAMGALEFEPALDPGTAEPDADRVDVARMVELASAILRERAGIATRLPPAGDDDALRQLLAIGTSPGGARAKALVAWNPATGELASGQVPLAPGFEPWIIKFDGVSENRDRDLADPLGYSLVEYAYHRMAVDAGITMSECRLLSEGGRHHFMTRRFDRTADGGKLHMQSLGALRHLDFNDPSAPHGYEDAFLAARALGLGDDDAEEQFRRMALNVAARNQDDHVKNISYLMRPDGSWSLSPAYDVTFAVNPTGWTRHHQLRVRGRAEGITRADLLEAGLAADLRRARCTEALDAVLDAVERWPEHAAAAGVPEERAEAIRAQHRVAALRGADR